MNEVLVVERVVAGVNDMTGAVVAEFVVVGFVIEIAGGPAAVVAGVPGFVAGLVAGVVG